MIIFEFLPQKIRSKYRDNRQKYKQYILSHRQNKMSASPNIEGTISSDYKSLRQMFTENFKSGRESHAQLCVYVKGEKVVDLWGSMEHSGKFTGDTLTNVFSSTKSLTSLAMAMMVDRGLISYTDKISKHWPEFGRDGKHGLTLADLMRHEAGLVTFDHEFEPLDFWPENIKQNNVGKVIEKQVQKWPAQGRREYHALTRGWIANEIFRRVNPDGLTIGEFLQAEVASPLGTEGIVIGAKDRDIPRYQSLKNTEFDAGNPRKRMMINHPGDESGEIWNSEDIRRGETPSSNGNCSARGLAKVGAALANQGKLGDTTLLSLSGWKALHSEATVGTMLGYENHFTQGGVASWTGKDVRAGFFGWMGYGGSCFQWHPELQISFAYVPCLLIPSLTSRDERNRARALQVELVKCVTELLNQIC